ncbi:TPA: hypothetical protein DDW35_10075, partial [Candidatus Sumerlaeota bacterium]|nr:hypothetical protein [Candidatus Sumerlaeota bacterium]
MKKETPLILALLLACLGVYGGYLLGYMPVGEDSSLQFAPYYYLRWEGWLPSLIDPFSQGGTPVYDVFAPILSLLRLPFYWVKDWRLYYGPFTFLHYLAAFLGMACSLRLLRLRPLAVFAGAAVFALGGHIAGRPINPAILMASIWIPLLLGGAAGCGRRHFHLATLALTLLYTAVHPQSMIYGSAGYVIALLILNPRTQWKRCLPQGALAGVIAFCIASPLLIPSAQRTMNSVRQVASVEANLADSLEFSEIPNILLGGSGGSLYPEYLDKTCYVGCAALAIIVWLFFQRAAWRDRRVVLGVVFFFAGLLVALGKNVGWDVVFSTIPGLRLLTGPLRALILSSIGLSLLAACGMEYLCEAANRTTPKFRYAPLFVSLLALSLACFAAVSVKLGMSAANALHCFTTWLSAPQALPPFFFFWMDAGIFLAVVGFGLLPFIRHPRRLPFFLLVCILIQLWHFMPRVNPPIQKASYFDAPAGIQYLQKQRDAQPNAPFRVVGYDPLRIHDSDMNETHKFENLMPNLAGIYGLEDIQAFNPLIESKYVELVQKTAGRSPVNDPMRKLEIAQPSLDLFDQMGVRYLLGHPYNRRLTPFPLTLKGGDAPSIAVDAWPTSGTHAAITDWLFVSLTDGTLVAPGTPIASLEVEAQEGHFSFPVRFGVETHHIEALNIPELGNKISPEQIHSRWNTPVLNAECHWTVETANYRGQIHFPQPLHVQSAAWKLNSQKNILYVASQAYRLERPPQESDPWRLAFGDENQTAPVFEYRLAKPRAELNSLDGATTNTLPGEITWVSKRANTLQLRCQSETAALLFLRERWTPGWKASVNGKPTPMLNVHDGFRAVELPAGTSEVTLAFRPTLFFALLGLSAAVFIGWAASLVPRWRKSRRPTGRFIFFSKFFVLSTTHR